MIENRTKVKIEGFDVELIAKRLFLNDKIGLFASQTLYNYSIPYIPMDTGMLYSNVDFAPFEMTFNQNYAKYVYENNRGVTFHRYKHPLATERWDEAVMVAHSKEIANEIEKGIRRIR